ncbi:MAG: membrane protein insertion efficiency factor YidD [Desulfobulbus sp.]|nr:membrane protein insertion efficiency factor YidD [Desulfobulbus sp.]
MSSDDNQSTNSPIGAIVRFSWRTFPRVCLISVFKGYQYFISPLFPPVCRFVPSCSQYAIEAVRKYGVFRGTLLAMWRIVRCHPFSRGGYDPVK